MEESKEAEDRKCPICSEDKESETTTFVCEHSFCQTCIVQWYRNCVAAAREPTCPLCRKIDNVWGS